MKQITTEQIIKQTQTWLRSFIIKYNICPFAKREDDRNSIHYCVVSSKSTEQCLEAVFTECQRLDNDEKIETTLIIFSDHFSQFDDYLDFLSIAESLLEEQHYEGIYQLASFHPLYCFEGEAISDPANYTNRPPYPMLHLISETSLERALQSYPNPELIPERNIKLTRELGNKQIQAILNSDLNSRR